MGRRNSGEGHLLFACPKREGQHKFDTTKRWVTINFTASRGRVIFFNTKYKGRARRFYIHAHGDSSGPPRPLLTNECSLRMRYHNFLFAFLHTIQFSIITLHIVSCRTHILIFVYYWYRNHSCRQTIPASKIALTREA